MKKLKTQILFLVILGLSTFPFLTSAQTQTPCVDCSRPNDEIECVRILVPGGVDIYYAEPKPCDS